MQTARKRAHKAARLRARSPVVTLCAIMCAGPRSCARSVRRHCVVVSSCQQTTTTTTDRLVAPAPAPAPASDPKWDTAIIIISAVIVAGAGGSRSARTPARPAASGGPVGRVPNESAARIGASVAADIHLAAREQPSRRSLAHRKCEFRSGASFSLVVAITGAICSRLDGIFRSAPAHTIYNTHNGPLFERYAPRAGCCPRSGGRGGRGSSVVRSVSEAERFRSNRIGASRIRSNNVRGVQTSRRAT